MGLYWAIFNHEKREFIDFDDLTGSGDKMNTWGHPRVGKALCFLYSGSVYWGYSLMGHWRGTPFEVLSDEATGDQWYAWMDQGYSDRFSDGKPAYTNISRQLEKEIAHLFNGTGGL